MNALNVLAVVALALWASLNVAYAREGLKPRGSAGVRALNALAEMTMIAALIWAAIPS